MTSQKIQRTEYLVPGSGLPRLGSTTHAESAVDVTGYLVPLEQVHGSALHGSGVADGLAVTAVPGSASVQIAPGVAVDATGRHISLAAGGTAEISPDPANSSQLVPVATDGVALPTTGHTGNCVVTVTWRETFDQAQFASSGQKIFQDNHTPWLRVSPATSPPADDHPPVVLATVSLDANGNVLPDGLTAEGRHSPAPAVEAVQLRAASQTTAGTALSVADTVGGLLRARPGGGLELHVSDPTSPVDVNAQLGVSGNVSAGSVSAGSASISGNASVSGNVSAGVISAGGVSAGSASISGNASVSGNVAAGSISAVSASADSASISGNASVSGNVSAGSVSVARDSTDFTLAASNVTGTALCATSTNGTGIGAASTNGNALTAFGPSTFLGNVNVGGTLTANTKDFLIDHPADPGNKYLRHTSIESPERTNIYSGNVVLDAAGEARVQLPEWVEALNKDFGYQLTCIGQPAQVYVAQEISEAVFIIAGGRPGMKVCWQVTGIRNDAWAQAHPFQVEEEKPDAEKGYYLHPKLFGQDLAKSVHWQRHQDAIKRNRALFKEITKAEGHEGEYSAHVQSLLG